LLIKAPAANKLVVVALLIIPFIAKRYEEEEFVEEAF